MKDNDCHRIELSRKELAYLVDADFLTEVQLAVIRHARWQNGNVAVLVVTRMTAETFRDRLTIQMAKVGFDEMYEPTAEGRLIEELIDRFFVR